MTPTRDDSIPGLGPRSGVPRLASQVDWSALDFDDVHGFVLSRIDGRTTLGEVCLLSPFPEGQTTDILRSLFARGVIDIPGVTRPPSLTPRMKAMAPPPAMQRPSSSDKVPAAAQRPVSSDRVPAAAQRPVSSDRVPAAAQRPSSSDKVPATAQRPSSSDKVPAAPRERSSDKVPAVRAADRAAPARPPEEAAEVVDLQPDVRERIDEMLALVSRGDPAALLGVAPGTDKKEVRRAYFRLSKEFHPDRYFKRQLGPYKKKLQAVFNALTEAAEQLTGDGKQGD